MLIRADSERWAFYWGYIHVRLYSTSRDTQIYANINHLIEPELTEPIFLNLLKPRVLTKLVKIAHAIDGYYN